MNTFGLECIMETAYLVIVMSSISRYNEDLYPIHTPSALAMA